METARRLSASDFLNCGPAHDNHPRSKKNCVVDWIAAATLGLVSLDSPWSCIAPSKRKPKSQQKLAAGDVQQEAGLGDAEAGTLSGDFLTELMRPIAVAGVLGLQASQQLTSALSPMESLCDACARVTVAAGPLVPIPALLDRNFEQRPQTCMCIAIWSIWLKLVLGSVAGGSLVMHASTGGFQELFRRFFSDPTFHHWALLIPLPILLGTFIQALEFYALSKDADGFGAGVVKLFGGKPAPRDLENRVRRIATKAEFPEGTPKVYLIPSPEVNAFATGLQIGDSVVAVTEGILHIGMNDDELDAVLAHEIGHIRNQDIVSGMHLSVMIAGFSSLMSWGMRLWFANLNQVPEAPPQGETEAEKEQRERKEKAAKALPMAMMVVGALQFIPGRLMQRWHSRQREFAADEAALALTGTEAMATALEKIESKVVSMAGQGDAARPGVFAIRGPQFGHQYLTEPESAAKWIARMLATHPPTQDRAKAIRDTLVAEAS